jgi:hypothetical protein
MPRSAIAVSESRTAIRSNDVPVWVLSALNTWGRQKRRIWEGGATSRSGHRHVDGYVNSLLGRIREEREGAGQGARTMQRWPEVYQGVGLEVQRALVGMPERPFCIVHLHYVWDPRWCVPLAQKAFYAGLKRSQYFGVLACAQTWTFARLERETSPDSQPIDAINSFIAQLLQTPRSDCIRRPDLPEHSPAQASNLDFRPLQRPTLSLSRRR